MISTFSCFPHFSSILSGFSNINRPLWVPPCMETPNGRRPIQVAWKTTTARVTPHSLPCQERLGKSHGGYMKLAGWLVWSTHSSSRGHRHNLHQQISGSAPETSLLPSPQSSGGLLEQKQEQEEGRKTKEDPKQAERATTTNELKSPTSTGYQLFSQAQVKPKTPTVRNPLGGRIKHPWRSTTGTMHHNHGQCRATRQGEIPSQPSTNFFKRTGHFPTPCLQTGARQQPKAMVADPPLQQHIAPLRKN